MAAKSAPDTDRLNAFLGRFVSDLGATVAAGGVVVGHRLGLYRALADGPADPEELAGRTGTHPRYVAEWLRGQAAGGYVEYDAATGAFSLTEEQAFALTDPEGPLYVPGAFVLALGTLRAESQITDAFRTGAGMGWHEQHDDVPVGCEMFFRPGYLANLVPSWIPALDGAAAKLNAGRPGPAARSRRRARSPRRPRWPPRPAWPRRRRAPGSSSARGWRGSRGGRTSHSRPARRRAARASPSPRRCGTRR